MEPILQVQNLNFIYSAGTPFQHKALEDVSFSVERGEFIGIIGHTGSGKSTLMQQLNGLLKPTSGKILLDGQDIWSDKKLTRQARFRVGLVFQYPEYQLFEETVYKDIAFGPKNMGLKEDEIDRRVREAATIVGLTEAQLEVSPFDLSGGQKRRVTIMMVSHSMDDVARLTDRLLVLNGSHLAMDGTPAEVFSRAEELVEMGLNIPQVTRVFLELRKMGLDVQPVYTLQQAIDVLTSLKGGASSC